jgi:hypothetical protein
MSLNVARSSPDRATELPRRLPAGELALGESLGPPSLFNRVAGRTVVKPCGACSPTRRLDDRAALRLDGGVK